jgi:diguanylate cyclase (GGDEF)-like protein
MNETSLSLVMIDVDNFKHYNDTLGHINGDEALKKISSVLHSKSRQCDIAARYGGEEFGIVMPNTSKENARLFSERLRNEVEKTFADEDAIDAAHRLTVSCGIATYPEDADNKNELVSRADLALYEAKHAGKNRTCLYSKVMGDKHFPKLK